MPRAKTKNNKLFVVRKYVWAESAIEAIKLEKEALVDDVWLDDDWKKSNPNGCDYNIGFSNKT